MPDNRGSTTSGKGAIELTDIANNQLRVAQHTWIVLNPFKNLNCFIIYAYKYLNHVEK